MALLLGNHSCFVWLDYKLHKGQKLEDKAGKEVSVQIWDCHGSLANLDTVSLEFRCQQ